MSILIIGGTGMVGSQIVPRLMDRGASVRVMTHTAEKIAALPAGVEGVLGDMSDPPSLQKAFAGIESAVLIVPVHPDETAHGKFAVKAAKKAGVKQIVYVSVGMPAGSGVIPHFASKMPVENSIKESGMVYTILRPNNFFQNDIWFQEAIVRYGVYPQPIGAKGLSRIDVRDIADAVVNALQSDGHNGRTYNLHGPDLLTGKSTAQAYGRHLGSEVNYAGDDLDAWQESALKMMPTWMVHDFRIMYQYFQDSGFAASASEMIETETALQHPPRSFDAFVSETIAVWKS